MRDKWPLSSTSGVHAHPRRPAGLQKRPLHRLVHSVAPCRRRGSPEAKEEPRAPICQGGALSPNLQPTSENSRQEKTPNSRGSWQPLSPAERFLQITPYSRDRGRTPHVPASTVCGFSAAWAHLGQAARPWVGDALEDVAALIGRGLPFCGRTWRPVPSRASPGAPGVGVTGVTEALLPSPS